MTDLAPEHLRSPLFPGRQYAWTRHRAQSSIHTQLPLSPQTLTGADEPQSMIVMSYRSPWENTGTERGEVGGGNQRTLAHSKRWTAQREREKLEMNYIGEKPLKDRTSIAALENSDSLSLIVLLKIDIKGKAIWPERGRREVLSSPWTT